MAKINESNLNKIFTNLKNGDETAFEELYKNYHDLVFRIAFSILKNKENSEDVVQDVFAKLMKLDKEKFPTQGQSSWLYTVTKNEVMQWLRKQKHNIAIDDLYTLESESDEIEDIVDMESYYHLLKGLPAIEQEIISLRVLSDFTFDKIAQMLNMPLGTVQWRYYKAMHSLRLSLSNLAAFVLVFTLWRVMEQPKGIYMSEKAEGNQNEDSEEVEFESAISQYNDEKNSFVRKTESQMV